MLRGRRKVEEQRGQMGTGVELAQDKHTVEPQEQTGLRELVGEPQIVQLEGMLDFSGVIISGCEYQKRRFAQTQR